MRGTSLRSKLILFFLLVTIIPILTLGLVSYNVSSRIVQQKVISENLNRLELIRSRANQVFKDKQFTAIKFGMDEKVLYLLSHETSLNEESRSKYEFEVRKLLYDYSNVNGTLSIGIISHHNLKYTNSSYDERTDDAGEWAGYGNFLNGVMPYSWLKAERIDGNTVIPLLRKIVNYELQTVGVLVLNMKESLLSDTYSEFAPDNPVSFHIVNGQGSIISSPDKSIIGMSMSEHFGIGVADVIDASGYYTRTVGGEKNLLIYLTDNVSGMKYLCLMPVREMLKSTAYIKSLTLFICSMCLIICFAASLVIAQSITRPMKKLIRSIETFQFGELNAAFETHRNDEFGRIGQSYSSLIGQLKAAINDFYNEQQKKKEAEIKALEFQINPHFLYNTLSSVIWLCEESDNRTAIKITKALAQFFRISISKGKEMIAVREEIEHVRTYIEIQNLRYSQYFDAVFDVDPSILTFVTPKIILQPLVENAIYHGIKKRTASKGVIAIRGRLAGEDIVFEVMDNGGGMDETQMREMNRFLESADRRKERGDGFGIGIGNVHDRVRLYFGQEYGLSFYREDGYTVARVRIKAVKGDGKHV